MFRCLDEKNSEYCAEVTVIERALVCTLLYRLRGLLSSIVVRILGCKLWSWRNIRQRQRINYLIAEQTGCKQAIIRHASAD